MTINPDIIALAQHARAQREARDAKILENVPEWRDTEVARTELEKLRRFAVDELHVPYTEAYGEILDPDAVLHVRSLYQQKQQEKAQKAAEEAARTRAESERRLLQDTARLQAEQERREAEESETRRRERLENAKRVATGRVHNNMGARAESLAEMLEDESPSGDGLTAHERMLFKKEGILSFKIP